MRLDTLAILPGEQGAGDPLSSGKSSKNSAFTTSRRTPWVLIGNTICGGAGIGIGHTDGNWQANPFYALRAGVELQLGEMGLDAYASYQLQSGAELEDLTGEDLDSLTLAALLRFGL